ncbi:MAG: hypothetical protein Ct9H90mP8_2140 [Pseudomonadota bacterium]|nr:MAG: hypothetical protein Ct9H90mP8_2140 [Pseudomonadota bacterium]
MLCNPNNDVMVEPGDTLLFMAKSEEERDLEIFLPGRFALHDPNRKEELDDRQAALLAEAEELFKQGVLLSRKQDGAQEAYQLFHEAAIKGFSRAKYNLGILNFHGKGVPRNVDEAYYWFQEAAVEGNEPARKALDSIKTLRESEEQFKNSEKELNMVQMDHLTEDQRFWYAKAITKIILADGRIDLYERVICMVPSIFWKIRIMSVKLKNRFSSSGKSTSEMSLDSRIKIRNASSMNWSKLQPSTAILILKNRKCSVKSGMRWDLQENPSRKPSIRVWRRYGNTKSAESPCKIQSTCL